METVRYRPSPRVLSQAVHDELVLLDLDAGTYFGLNAIGARVWEGLARERSLTEVLGELLNVYEVSAARLETDVAALIDDLLERGLLQRL